MASLRIPTPYRDGSRLVCSECGCAFKGILEGDPNYMEDGCDFQAPDICLCHTEWATLTWEGQPGRHAA